MTVIIRLQNLPWTANALDIRRFFQGLAVPDGGVHIVGGEKGDAFIAFATDEDARQAMYLDQNRIGESPIKLLLSSKTEMQNVIAVARGAAPPNPTNDFNRPNQQAGPGGLPVPPQSGGMNVNDRGMNVIDRGMNDRGMNDRGMNERPPMADQGMGHQQPGFGGMGHDRPNRPGGDMGNNHMGFNQQVPAPSFDNRGNFGNLGGPPDRMPGFDRMGGDSLLGAPDRMEPDRMAAPDNRMGGGPDIGPDRMDMGQNRMDGPDHMAGHDHMGQDRMTGPDWRNQDRMGGPDRMGPDHMGPDRMGGHDRDRPGGRDNRPGGRDDRMGGRDERMGGRDDRMGGRDDRMDGRNDRPGGRDDRMGGRDDRLGGRNDRMGGRDDRMGGHDDRMGGRDDRMGGRDDRMGSRDDRMGGRDDRMGGHNDRMGGRDDRMGGPHQMRDGPDRMSGPPDRIPGGPDRMPGPPDHLSGPPDRMPRAPDFGGESQTRADVMRGPGSVGGNDFMGGPDRFGPAEQNRMWEGQDHRDRSDGFNRQGGPGLLRGPDNFDGQNRMPNQDAAFPRNDRFEDRNFDLSDNNFRFNEPDHRRPEGSLHGSQDGRNMGGFNQFDNERPRPDNWDREGESWPRRNEPESDNRFPPDIRSDNIGRDGPMRRNDDGFRGSRDENFGRRDDRMHSRPMEDRYRSDDFHERSENRPHDMRGDHDNNMKDNFDNDNFRRQDHLMGRNDDRHMPGIDNRRMDFQEPNRGGFHLMDRRPDNREPMFGGNQRHHVDRGFRGQGPDMHMGDRGFQNRGFGGMGGNDRKRGGEEVYIFTSNMPKNVTYQMIRRFFTKLVIPSDGLKLINDKLGNRVGTAYIMFGTEMDCLQALQREGQLMEGRRITIDKCSRQEFEEAVDSFRPPGYRPAPSSPGNPSKRARSRSPMNAPSQKPGSNCIMLKNVHFKCAESDIKKFLLDNASVKIHSNGGPFLIKDKIGRSSGMAFVEFDSKTDCQNALKCHQKYLFNRPVDIIPVSKHEFDKETRPYRKDTKESGKDSGDKRQVELKEDTREREKIESKSDQPSQGDSKEEEKKMYCIKMKGLPFSANPSTIRDFFGDLQIADRGITIINNRQGQAAGPAFVEFVTASDCKKACEKNNQHIGKRYIEIKAITKKEMLVLKDQEQGISGGHGSSSTVKMANLPYNVQLEDIMTFFRNYRPLQETVRLRYTRDKKPTGDAMLSFSNPSDAQKALRDLNGKPMMGRAVRLELE